MDMVATETRPNELEPLSSFPSEVTRTQLAAAIHRLPLNDRLLLSMLHFEELTLAETALVLDMTVSDVLTQHAVAMRILRGFLK